MAVLIAAGIGSSGGGGMREAQASDLDDLPRLRLPSTSQGEAAVQLLGTRLPEVARAYGHDAERLRALLRRDRTLHVDRSGRLHYLEPSAVASPVTPSDAAAAVVAAAEIPLTETFKLHSRPGSRRTLFLDFDGHTLTGTAWNDSYAAGAAITAGPFDIDSTPAFSTTELTRIQGIWKRVAEDYAPFDVDVTTEFTSEAALTRSGSTDLDFGVRVLISPLSYLVGNYGGIAYVGVFDSVGDYYKTALVFPEKLGQSEKNIAEAISHEAGHTLGLNHDGTTAGVGYYTGQGSGETGWAPIMGAGYYQNVTQWSKGEYNLADNKQDDLAVMQTHGLAPVPDDHGNSAASATYLAAGPSFSASGVIGLGGDRDVFAFSAGAGLATISVTPASTGPNLDLLIELYDSGGALLATNNPATQLAANLSLTLSGGTYFLHVRGTGAGDPLVSGYTAYASLGQYLLSGTVVDPSGSLAPVAVATATPLSGTVPFVVAFDGRGSFDQDGTIASSTWSFGDGGSGSGLTASHTYSTAGTYTAKLTVIDDDGLFGEDTVAIQALAPNVAPTANVTATPISGTAPLLVTLDGSASWDSDGSIAKYSWNFGDGTAAALGAVVQHTYQKAGTNTATLTVTDNRGGTSTRSVVIKATAAPLQAMRVQSIALTTSKNTQGTVATAKVLVTTTTGTAVSGVTVTGNWGGIFSGTSSGTTDASGIAVLTSNRVKKTGTATFSVTKLAKTGYTYSASQNLVTTASVTAAAPR